MAILYLFKIFTSAKKFSQATATAATVFEGTKQVYGFAKQVYSDAKNRRSKTPGPEAAQSVSVPNALSLRDELLSEIEKVEGRVMEQAEMISRVAEQVAVSAAALKEVASRSVLAMWVGIVAFGVGIAALMVAGFR